jgi:hypothetical protein
MSKLYYLADFFEDDKLAGGAELSDAAIREHLDLPFECVRYWELDKLGIDKDAFYIVANRSLVSPSHLDTLIEYKNYIIIEHDYQFVGGPGNGRNPYVFDKAVVPDEHKTQLEFYKNAKAVFFQTDYQKRLFELNRVEGYFVSMGTTPYSTEDFKFFRELLKKEFSCKTRSFAVVDSPKEIKNTKGAISFCDNNDYDYDLLPPMERDQFLKKLSEYPAMVFFPLTPESCCRLVTEARILGLNVITSKSFGASTADWFKLSGEDLVDELERITLEDSIPTIRSFLPDD